MNRAMRRIVSLSVVLLIAASPLVATQPHCTLRLHTEANPRDTEVFAAQVQSKFTGKTVTIQKTPTISERDVVAFYPYPARDGSYGALFELDDHGRIALDTLSIERRGTFLFVFANGRPITELQIDRRISDGKIYIASGLFSADIELMKKEWRVIGRRKK